MLLKVSKAIDGRTKGEFVKSCQLFAFSTMQHDRKNAKVTLVPFQCSFYTTPVSGQVFEANTMLGPLLVILALGISPYALGKKNR